MSKVTKIALICFAMILIGGAIFWFTMGNQPNPRKLPNQTSIEQTQNEEEISENEQEWNTQINKEEAKYKVDEKLISISTITNLEEAFENTKQMLLVLDYARKENWKEWEELISWDKYIYWLWDRGHKIRWLQKLFSQCHFDINAIKDINDYKWIRQLSKVAIYWPKWYDSKENNSTIKSILRSIQKTTENFRIYLIAWFSRNLLNLPQNPPEWFIPGTDALIALVEHWNESLADVAWYSISEQSFGKHYYTAFILTDAWYIERWNYDKAFLTSLVWQFKYKPEYEAHLAKIESWEIEEPETTWEWENSNTETTTTEEQPTSLEEQEKQDDANKEWLLNPSIAVYDILSNSCYDSKESKDLNKDEKTPISTPNKDNQHTKQKDKELTIKQEIKDDKSSLNQTSKEEKNDDKQSSSSTVEQNQKKQNKQKNDSKVINKKTTKKQITPKKELKRPNNKKDKQIKKNTQQKINKSNKTSKKNVKWQSLDKQTIKHNIKKQPTKETIKGSKKEKQTKKGKEKIKRKSKTTKEPLQKRKKIDKKKALKNKQKETLKKEKKVRKKEKKRYIR